MLLRYGAYSIQVIYFRYVPKAGAPSNLGGVLQRRLRSRQSEVIPSVSNDNLHRVTIGSKLSTTITSEDIATNIDSGKLKEELFRVRTHKRDIL